MEKEILSESEILEILKNKLVKGSSVNSLCEELNISDYDLFGYVKQLKDENINVTFSDKGSDISLIINNHPDYTKENEYRIEDVNDDIKIGVISDLRFGSKNEQIAILNDIYRKFLKDGVKYVFITGNLLEGKYSGNTEHDFGKSLIYNSAEGQCAICMKKEYEKWKNRV